MTGMGRIGAAAAIGLLALVSSSAWATTVIDIDFEGDAIGAPPAVDGTPGDPVTMPYSIGGYGGTAPPSPNPNIPPLPGNGTILVGTPSGGSREAVFVTNSNNPELGALWLDTAFNLAGQQISMSFDVNVLAAPVAATSQPKILGAGTAGILLGMNTYTTAGWAFRFAAAPTSASGGVFAFRTPDNTELIPFFNYAEGVQYSLRIDADYSAGKLDAYVDGVKQLDDYAFWASGSAGVATNEFFFHLNGEAGYANSVSLDNIAAVAAVPEAPALLFGGVACAALGLTAIGRRGLRMLRAA